METMDKIFGQDNGLPAIGERLAMETIVKKDECIPEDVSVVYDDETQVYFVQEIRRNDVVKIQNLNDITYVSLWDIVWNEEKQIWTVDICRARTVAQDLFL